MVVGLPMGTVHHNNAVWTKVQLPDGREIGIGTTAPEKISDVARHFLLAEKKAGHPFIDLDRIIDGVPVAFLNPFDQFPPATPPCAVWTKVQLPDGREIGIGTTAPEKISDVARHFLLAEKKAGHPFIDLDRIIDGVPVAFLNPFDQFPPATPPWQHKEREWMWVVLGLSAGLAIYVVFRATGWIINGFLAGPRE